MIQKGYFNSDKYDTPAKEKLTFSDRLWSNSRLYFTLKYASIVFKTRKQAKSGTYDTRAWEDSSFYILKHAGDDDTSLYYIASQTGHIRC
jgi:hypothetical protein